MPRKFVPKYHVPEEVQKPLRDRLLAARVAHGLTRSGLQFISDGTLRVYETEDLSTMKIKDLHQLANVYGWSLPEILMYLANYEESPVVEVDRLHRRLSSLLRVLPGDLQQLAIALVESLMKYNQEERGGRSLRQAPRPTVYQSPQEALEALENASNAR